MKSAQDAQWTAVSIEREGQKDKDRLLRQIVFSLLEPNNEKNLRYLCAFKLELIYSVRWG